jgi:hypothetical protein
VHSTPRLRDGLRREMNEEQFTAFLRRLFSLMARDSLDGALHFICMEQRNAREREAPQYFLGNNSVTCTHIEHADLVIGLKAAPALASAGTTGVVPSRYCLPASLARSRR